MTLESDPASHRDATMAPSVPSPLASNPTAETDETPACSATKEGGSSCPPYPLLASNASCCRICLDDDPHGLYSPCRCRGSIKFVHSHCLTRWRKSLMAHGRDESANSCTMCGFNYVLKKRARFYELISYRGIRIAITVLFVLAMLFPSGYVMKVCVLLSGYKDTPGTTPATYFESLRDIPTNMGEMNVFPICKANSNRLSFGKFYDKPARIGAMSIAAQKDDKDGASATKSGAAMLSLPSHFISLFPGPYAPRFSNSNMYTTAHQSKEDPPASEAPTTPQTDHPDPTHEQSVKSSPLQGSLARLATGIDIVGSSQFASMLLYPFSNDRLWHFLLCRLQHLHLGFFLLGSASNVYMACRMLSDMYDLIITPPHSRYIKNIFLFLTSVFVIWFWFSYNLMAFRVSTTEEEFMSELPLWALRWINVGVAIVDLSYRRIYNRLGRLKVEEELLDISDVEKVEQMQQKAWLHQQQRFLQYGQEQGQYLLGQFMALEVKQSILNGASAAVDAVSDVYSKTSIPSFPPIPNSLASAVTMMSSSSSSSSSLSSTVSFTRKEPEVAMDQSDGALHGNTAKEILIR